jgi:hypothetical protein
VAAAGREPHAPASRLNAELHGAVLPGSAVTAEVPVRVLFPLDLGGQGHLMHGLLPPLGIACK